MPRPHPVFEDDERRANNPCNEQMQGWINKTQLSLGLVWSDSLWRIHDNGRMLILFSSRNDGMLGRLRSRSSATHRCVPEVVHCPSPQARMRLHNELIVMYGSCMQAMMEYVSKVQHTIAGTVV